MLLGCPRIGAMNCVTQHLPAWQLVPAIAHWLWAQHCSPGEPQCVQVNSGLWQARSPASQASPAQQTSPLPPQDLVEKVSVFSQTRLLASSTGAGNLSLL